MVRSRSHNPVLNLSFMGYYQIFSKSNATVATSGAGTSSPSGALKRTIWFVLLNLWLGLFMFCGLSDLFIFFWSLYCLFFNSRFLVTSCWYLQTCLIANRFINDNYIAAFATLWLLLRNLLLYIFYCVLWNIIYM